MIEKFETKRIWQSSDIGPARNAWKWVGDRLEKQTVGTVKKTKLPGLGSFEIVRNYFDQLRWMA